MAPIPPPRGTLYELAQTNHVVHAASPAIPPPTRTPRLARVARKTDVDAHCQPRGGGRRCTGTRTNRNPSRSNNRTGATSPNSSPPSRAGVATGRTLSETQVIPAEEQRTPPPTPPAAAAAAARVPLTVERVPVAQTFGQQPTPVEPPPLEPEPPAEEAGSRRRLVAILVVVGILVIAGIAWLLGRGGDEPDAGPTAGPTATAPATSSPTTPAPTATTPTADPQAALDAASVALADAVEGMCV